MISASKSTADHSYQMPKQTTNLAESYYLECKDLIAAKVYSDGWGLKILPQIKPSVLLPVFSAGGEVHDIQQYFSNHENFINESIVISDSENLAYLHFQDGR